MNQLSTQLLSHMGSSTSGTMPLPSTEQGRQLPANITRYHHINGKKNPSNILSKHWDMPSVWDSLKPLLFWWWTNAEKPPCNGSKKDTVAMDSKKESMQRQDPNNHGLIKGSDKMCNFIHDSMES
jgi:N-acetylmuramoyl-L-alanine amidase CwlA